MTFYLPQPADGANAEGGGALDLVAGERLPAVLDGQAVLTNPHGNLLPGKPFFGAEPETLKGEVTEAVEDARVADREERPDEVFFPVAWPLDPGEHLGGRTPACLAMLVGIVPLEVVVVQPPVVLREYLGPVPSLGEVV